MERVEDGYQRVSFVVVYREVREVVDGKKGGEIQVGGEIR
jgi:hypothetical protein